MKALSRVLLIALCTITQPGLAAPELLNLYVLDGPASAEQRREAKQALCTEAGKLDAQVPRLSPREADYVNGERAAITRLPVPESGKRWVAFMKTREASIDLVRGYVSMMQELCRTQFRSELGFWARAANALASVGFDDAVTNLQRFGIDLRRMEGATSWAVARPTVLSAVLDRIVAPLAPQ